MVQNGEDLRVRRPLKMLQYALIELSTEKGFAAVTMSDLTERAMVNRSTYYRPFADKYELLRQYLEDLLQLIDSEQVGHAATFAAGEPPAGLVSLLRHLQTHAAFYRVMLGPNGDAAFCAQSFRGYLEKGFRSLLLIRTQITHHQRLTALGALLVAPGCLRLRLLSSSVD